MPSIINADNGVVSGSVGLKYSTDNTGTLALQTNSNTAVTIDTSGNVGVGETSPAGSTGYTQLVVRGTSGAELSLKGGSTQYGYVYVDNGGFRIINPQSGSASGTLQFHTSNTERMRIDASGRVTKPYQPYCLVGKTNGNVSAQNTILFDQIQANIGSHYNSGTGRFTAPIAGYYYASLSILGTTSSGIEGSIKKNGSVVVNTRGGGASGYTSASSSAVIYLAANDYLFAYVEGSYTADGGSGYPYTGMTVYLLG